MVLKLIGSFVRFVEEIRKKKKNCGRVMKEGIPVMAELWERDDF